MSVEIAELLSSSDAVVAGTVVAVAEAPNAWSGMLTVQQRVTYTVDSVFTGPIAEGVTLEIDHLLVKGSKTAAPEPGLRLDWFAKGKKVVLFLRKKSDAWEPLDENRGVAPAEPALLEALRSLD